MGAFAGATIGTMSLALVLCGLASSIVAVGLMLLVQWLFDAMPMIARVPVDAGFGALLLAASFVTRSPAVLIPACAVLASYVGFVFLNWLQRRTLEASTKIMTMLLAGNVDAWVSVRNVFIELKAQRGGIRGMFVGKALGHLLQHSTIESDEPFGFYYVATCRVRLRTARLPLHFADGWEAVTEKPADVQ